MPRPGELNLVYTQRSPDPDEVLIHNRKYLGSKFALLNFIDKVVRAKAVGMRTFADLFSGTGVVSEFIAAQGVAVIANDLLFSNYVTNRAFLTSTPRNCNREKLHKLLDYLNVLPGRDGYVPLNYGDRYFTMDNSRRIQAVRESIAELAADGRITEQEEFVLLTSLVYACDKVANTCGQYDAYLGHLGGPAYTESGTHQVDSNVYKPLALKMPRFGFYQGNAVHNADANSLVEEIAADAIYLDPPYNNRQYCDNYHVLENIARWERPELRGKTRKFDRTPLKSDWSTVKGAEEAFADLVAKVKCRHLFFSYNNEGIIGDRVIWDVLKTRGRPECFEHQYTVFGNGAGQSERRRVVERLFYCEVRDPEPL